MRENLVLIMQNASLIFWLNYYRHHCDTKHGNKTCQIIADLRKQVTDLEAKTLADLPTDAQEAVQTFKDR